MTITINSNGRPLVDTDATTVRGALDGMVGYEVVRIDIERADYISAVVKRHGVTYQIAITMSAPVAEAPAPTNKGGALATPKQIAFLRRHGHWIVPGMTKNFASSCIADIIANS